MLAAIAAAAALHVRVPAPLPGRGLVAVHQATPVARRAPAVRLDQFAGMKRADTPLDEEERALQVAGGALGVLIGPRIVGSSLIGLVLGLYGATVMANRSGRSGAWAREIGAQMSEKVTSLRRKATEEAQRREIPALARDAKAAAARVCQTIGNELSALDNATGARAKASDACSAVWAKGVAWADARGISPKVSKAWNASNLPQWIERCRANVQKRRAAAS